MQKSKMYQNSATIVLPFLFQEEWGLLFNYVYPYPDIVRETVKEIDTKQSLFVPLHTHKVGENVIKIP